jgi:uncharacterized metal-binding protein/malonyl CoA-acyl carrier protein transacylase
MKVEMQETTQAKAVTEATDTVTAVLPIAVIQGDDLKRCSDDLQKLAASLTGLHNEPFLAALAETQEKVAGPTSRFRVAIVAQTPNHLVQRCKLLAMAIHGGHQLDFLRKQGVFPVAVDASLRTAAVFPGQGMQYPNMLREVAARFPVVETTLAQADAKYMELCGRPLRPAFWMENPEDCKDSDEDTPCALFAVSCALFNLVQTYGVHVDAVMGQSISDISALVAAGVLSMDEGLEVVYERNQSILSLSLADPGCMTSLLCSPEKAEQLLQRLDVHAVVAAYNSPSACIVSSDRREADALMDLCGREGITAARVKISCAYHSQIISGAQASYQHKIDTLSFKRPVCHLVSSISGRSMRDLSFAEIGEDMADQLTKPVHVHQAIETLYEGGVRLFIECGPKWALTTYIDETLGGRPHVAQATSHPNVGELEQFYRALACMFAHGVGELRPRDRRADVRNADTVAPSELTTKNTDRNAAIKLDCAHCGTVFCRNRDNDKPPPAFCPMTTTPALLDEARSTYVEDPRVRDWAVQSARTEAAGYCKDTRVAEIMAFARRLDVSHLGLACCVGTQREARMAQEIFETNGFRVSSVLCKVGSLPKEEVGLTDSEKIRPGQFEALCNPIAQARLLKEAGAELNVLIGLCVGHDSLFFQYSEVPVTVLVVKDRVTGHNPAAALYTSRSYYRKLREAQVQTNSGDE